MKISQKLIINNCAKRNVALFFVFASAQPFIYSSPPIAFPPADRTVQFDIFAPGIHKPITFGLDLAWLDGNNIRRGIEFMGKENVRIIRSSFMPTNPLVGDTALQGDALTSINKRLDIIERYMGPGTEIMLNSDHPSVNPVFFRNPVNWTKLMKVTSQYHEKRGFKVVSVAPFNEPDLTSVGQGSVQDFVNINTEVRKDPYFNGRRISGPNTLNPDVFLNWYNPMKHQVDEGNTHQLAGSFDNYAMVFQTVRANGQRATNDELHNVMEAMVGVEYGMQTGIWWGTAELARGEFCKASNGVRLAYAEHRPFWTSASVYRHTDGRIQAFAGASERQSATTTYRFFSKDHDVFFDGHGPQREFVLELPGGAPGTYGTALHTNPERVINITRGADIQPVINGRYKLVNRKSGKVMEIASGNIRQNSYLGTAVQQWDVAPIDARIGGDFSYFKIANVSNGLCPDVLNFSLENGANIIPYTLMTANQQWYLDYAGDGWFYLRSRYTNKCIEVANSSVASGANIQQWTKNGAENQQWRFLPVTAPIEFVALAAPSNLVATNQLSSVMLQWTAPSDADVAVYTVFRADSANGDYFTIARNVKTTAYVDNTTAAGIPYFYAVKAVDHSLNVSEYSNQASTTGPGDNDLLLNLKFDSTTVDSTRNLNHGAHFGTAVYVDGKQDNALSLNGSTAFVQLPATIAGTNEITVAAWVFLRGLSYTQQLFSFGNNLNEFMNFNPRFNATRSRFVIKNGGAEQSLQAPFLPLFTWTHVTISLGSEGLQIYYNGKLVASSTSISLTPGSFKPALNYIGRSQNATDAMLNAYVDDFRVYNYALTDTEVEQIAGIVSAVSPDVDINTDVKLWPSPANDVVNVEFGGNEPGLLTTISVCSPDGKIIVSQSTTESKFSVSTAALKPGVYFLKLSNNKESKVKKFVVKR